MTLEPLEDRSLLAATITVNSTLDTVAPDNFLTLREALQVNNRTLDVATLSSAEQQQIVGTPTANDTDTIGFNIPGGGVHTITPSSPLPTITDPVVINGYTQPGASPNTNGPGLPDNAVLLVELSGTGPGASGAGLTIAASSSTIRGLVIDGFRGSDVASGSGITLQGGGRSIIAGNFLGTDPTGKISRGNTGFGVNIANSPGNTIGGAAPADRNIISGNGTGIQIFGAAANNNVVLGNFIGADATGAAALPNIGDGVRASGVNTIGGTTASAGNVILGNGGAAVTLPPEGFAAVSILGNTIFGNHFGIDLAGDGVTPNDVGDADAGPNSLQNFPEFTSASFTGSTLTVVYSVPSTTTNSAYPLRIEFFKADPATAQGKTFLGFDVYTANDAGKPKTASITPPAGITLAPGDRLVATASDSKGNTSEFSAAIDIAVKLPVGLDFGDAPNSYHTLLASDGPRHSLGAGPVLGKAITADADGKPSSTAAGDSGDDGVTLPTRLIAGLDAVATVIASAPGRLDAWIDFNRNGVFNANEQIAASLPVVAGANTVKFAVPLNAVGGASFARFRISTAGGLGPTGAAPDGEVEDYAVRTVVPASGTAILIDDPANPGKKVLVVTGTPQTDHIQIQRRGNLILCKNGCSIAVYNASSIGRIVVLGLDPRDTVQADPNLRIPLQVIRHRQR